MEEKDELMGEGVHALAHQGISMSRQQEMKNQHDAQQQFHSLLKEYMGKDYLDNNYMIRKALKKEGILYISCSLYIITCYSPIIDPKHIITDVDSEKCSHYQRLIG